MAENGSNYTLDHEYSYQDANEDKNHNRMADPVANLSDPQPGMILSDSDDDRLYHVGIDSAVFDEILQAARSYLAKPIFAGAILGVYSGAVSDPPTDAELDAIFTSPAALGDGVLCVLQDNNSISQPWIVFSDGTYYFTTKLNLAV